MGQVRHTTSGEVPGLRLDELLAEPESRIEAVRGTRDRVHDLLEAVLSAGRELDLPQLLRRIRATVPASQAHQPPPRAPR